MSIKVTNCSIQFRAEFQLFHKKSMGGKNNKKSKDCIYLVYILDLFDLSICSVDKISHFFADRTRGSYLPMGSAEHSNGSICICLTN